MNFFFVQESTCGLNSKTRHVRNTALGHTFSFRQVYRAMAQDGSLSVSGLSAWDLVDEVPL